jgi:PAT family beta-lactamase induction signal transducer AmpG
MVDGAVQSSRPRPWRDRRFLVLLGLGFSAGAPLPLVAGQVLRQWFTESGLSLGAIGLTALIGLAYANKFLWSPALDAVRPPLPLGQRRGWLLVIQLALVAAILGVATTDPTQGATLTVALAVVVAFLSASQDIVVDAWRIEMLGEDAERQAWGLAAYVWGYRLALLASGAGTLLLVQWLGWGGAYAVASLLLLPGMVAVLARGGKGCRWHLAGGRGCGPRWWIPSRNSCTAAAGWPSCSSSRCSSWVRRWPAS